MNKTKLTTKKDQQGVENSIVKDDNGYYKITLGAFNTYNASGIFYKIKNPETLLTTNTIFNRRLTNGQLRSELEHPDYKGMTNREIIERTIKIDLTNICAHIKAVEFVNTGRYEKGWEGYPITIIYGWVKPTGPHGPSLQESLDNPDENVAFSIRSLVKQYYTGSILTRSVLDISTFDRVLENGIAVATQWNAAGIESLNLTSDVGVCIDGSCIKDLTIAANENQGCELGECLLNIKDRLDVTPKIFKW